MLTVVLLNTFHAEKPGVREAPRSGGLGSTVGAGVKGSGIDSNLGVTPLELG